MDEEEPRIAERAFSSRLDCAPKRDQRQHHRQHPGAPKAGSSGWLTRLRLRSSERSQRDGTRADGIGVQRSCDILDILLSHVLERVGELVADLVPHRARYTNAAGFGQCLQPRGDIDAVAVDIITVDYD